MNRYPTNAITFTYTNWRGETSLRTAVPDSLWFGSTEWHSGDQWFMKALDVEKGEVRDFALVDIDFGKSQLPTQHLKQASK